MLEKMLTTFEDEAIRRNDMERAIRYNWIRNTYKTLQLDDDAVMILVQTVHYSESKDWPKLSYGTSENAQNQIASIGGYNNEGMHIKGANEWHG